ncbi:hypothetical protein PAXINDRAFT_157496 [Paxillus involutus ATCC 200175]|uniref:Unplaced genomic scaffold PAXINscaffold_72, whole genome shotgun sequence n=1 Tax=Paxillus involutus ATCC 200175 TaxID=664439 RepID=A0A0C9T560_PAXIN|nr:hypothetical protein PAXINDRAFT_157496 [Paxillus involutus ATCC 200175]
MSLWEVLDSWRQMHNQNQHSQAWGAPSDSNTPCPHPQQCSMSELKASHIEQEESLDLPTFSSSVDDMDIDVPYCPDSPSPPSVQGKSPQPSVSLFHDINQPQQNFTLGRTASTACELTRLPDTDNITATPTEKMSQCYKVFQQEFPEAWQEILAMYEEAEILGDVDKTVAQCQQLFHKSTKKLAQLGHL